MAEKTAIEILKDFAKRTGREPQSHVKDMSFFMNHTHTVHARTIWFADKPGSNRFFAASSNHKHLGIKASYSGVFIPLDIPQKAIANIRRKTLFDRLQLPNLRKTEKFNNKKLDKKLLISGEQIERASKILHDQKIQHEILGFMKKNPPYRVIINDIDLSYIPLFKSKSYLGLVRAFWEIDGENIEKLFEDIKQFEKHL
ncbi:MAG TPA: hypothetical protein VJ937_06820 [Salinivirga sp.]|uniref:hypothetical protein n=1 Tax=Salinivirga sp. TaxID=1970192 RepID=UPI002B45BC31|nr:hypothetical protein [Salinivirga sp.]HKK59172.1 hypothetical protein [Salinivirga sp.]